jgi:hypothetical protein
MHATNRRNRQATYPAVCSKRATLLGNVPSARMLSVEVFGPGGHDRNTAPEYVSGPAMINSFFHGLESVARGQNLVRIPIVREK